MLPRHAVATEPPARWTERNFESQSRAAARRRIHLQRATDRQRASAQTRQSVTGVGFAGIEAHAVIVHVEHQATVIDRELDAGAVAPEWRTRLLMLSLKMR